MKLSPLPTGTVTFLFTDIVDSTLLAQRYPAEMPALLSQHHTILRQSIEDWRGQVIRIVGDSFCAAFFTASEAVQAALQAQRLLQGAAWDPAALNVRMGIHTGPAQVGGFDERLDMYSGYLTLARAQRVMSTAHGGQVLVSSPSAELARGELPEGFELRDLGEHRLKGLLNPEHLWQVWAPGLPSDFPPLPSLNEIPNNLPVQISSFIGREREIAEAVRLLKSTRQLTLTGVGGVGKSRLSLQVAAEILEDFRDGVWLVELAPLADPALLVQSVANVLGVREVPGRALQATLTGYLRAKELLLLLDNCEHLIEACAQLAGNLLSACPSVRILASSREAVGIAGETILRVPSLTFPGVTPPFSLEELTRSEAVQLFIERARAVHPGFAVTLESARSIVQICQRLDGIPLAIELAAARVKMFSAEQILARLDDRFRLLTGGSRTALPRQQTLRALIDWSYELLPEEERVVLRRLAVFAGSWTFDAAEAVVVDGTGPSADLLDLLGHLINKSLVIVEEPANGREVRYRFLETIRQYAGEKLLESGEAARMRDRHLDFFLKFAEEAEPELVRHAQLDWLDRMESEHDNLRAALAWGLENDPQAALRVGGAVANFWLMRGYPIEGQDWLTRALERVDASIPANPPADQKPIPIRVKALLGLGAQFLSQGENRKAVAAFLESADLAREIGDRRVLVKALSLITTTEHFYSKSTFGYIEEGMAVAREIGDTESLAFALGGLGRYTAESGDIPAARVHLEESLYLFKKLGNRWTIGITLMVLGVLATHQGNYPQARAYFEESLELFCRIGDKYRIAMLQSELAHLERRRGQFDTALDLYRQTILAWQELGHHGGVSHHLECIAFICTAQGFARRAARLLGAAEALRESHTAPMTLMELDEYRPLVELVRQNLEEAVFVEDWAKGRAMPVDEAVAYALEPVNTGKADHHRSKQPAASPYAGDGEMMAGD